MGKKKVLKLLEAADWDNIIIQLTRYAVIRFQRYAWQSNLPKGNSPVDVAISAIEKVWDGTRNWTPDKYPNLVNHLKWIVKSDIDHLCSSKEHKSTGRKPVIKKEGTMVELGETACEHPHSIHARPLTPDEELIAKQKKEYEKTLIAELYDDVKGDDDLELIMLCFVEGIDKPKAIAIETNWDINKINNLKKRLFYRAVKIGEKIRTKEE